MSDAECKNKAKSILCFVDEFNSSITLLRPIKNVIELFKFYIHLAIANHPMYNNVLYIY